MKRLLPRCAVGLALLSSPLLAQIGPGNIAWTTPGGGLSQINLKSFDSVAQALGSPVAGTGVVTLKGVPLSGRLGQADTLLSHTALSKGQGSATIIALNLVSESPVVLQDGRSFNLQLCLPSTAQSAGSFAIAPNGPSGGNASCTLPVVPVLVFTGTNGNAVRIDCSVVPCPTLQVGTSSEPYAVTGGGSSFTPTAANVATLPSGNFSVANCDTQAAVSLVGQGGFYAGVAANSAGGFNPVSVQHIDTSRNVNHIVTPPLVPGTGSPVS